MEITVKNQQGEAVETIDLDDAVFNVPMNQSLVHQAMVIYQLNQRQGTHNTKTRANVSGGGRKPWIQKHTGRARQGSIRAPQWRHGGVVFGPHPRSYRKSLPRRMRHQALKCVLSEKARQNRLICLNSMDTVNGKTRSMVNLLQNLDVSGSALVITREADQTVVRAAHNLNKIWTLPVILLNAQELLRRDNVIITLDAVRWAEQFLAQEPPRGRGSQVEGTADDFEPAEGVATAVAEAGVEEAPDESFTPVAEQSEDAEDTEENPAEADSPQDGASDDTGGSHQEGEQ
jgi:large subunit ribosomal protein L4